MRKILLVAALAAVTPGCKFFAEADASTQASGTYLRCPAGSNVYSGRTDARCLDADTKGPLNIINGTVDSGVPSSLLNAVREDWLGWFAIPDADTTDVAQGIWTRQDAGSQATCGTRVGDFDDGAIEILLDNGNEVGDCTVYWGDEQNIDSDTEPVCIFRVQVSDALAAADTAAWGLSTARNALIESTTQNAMFMVVGADYGLDVSSDDSSADTGVDTTGVTLTADTYYDFKVSLNSMDGASVTNVKFFYRSALGGDWTALNTSTTYALAADAALQPFLQVEKTSGTTIPGIRADYVMCFWERS